MHQVLCDASEPHVPLGFCPTRLPEQTQSPQDHRIRESSTQQWSPVSHSMISGYRKILRPVKTNTPTATSWGRGEVYRAGEKTICKLAYEFRRSLVNNDECTLQQKAKARPFLTLPHSLSLNLTYFLNLLLNPASPARPVPRRSMVPGSGTGAPGVYG